MYFVTFCTQHSASEAPISEGVCLLLSQLVEQNQVKRLKVVETWTCDNQGLLRHQEVHSLDLGRGLRGVTFEITGEHFHLLRTACVAMASGQNTTLMPLEKTKTREDSRFRFNFSQPDLSNSPHPRAKMLSLLAIVLSTKQINRLLQGISNVTMEAIFLYSSGPLSYHEEPSGKIIHYRDAHEHSEVQLWWTLAFQECDFLSSSTKSLFELDKECCRQAKSVIKKLQGLEWCLLNTEVPLAYLECKRALINKIVGCYQSFSIIEPEPEDLKKPTIMGLTYFLLAPPRNEKLKSLEVKLEHAKKMFVSLNTALSESDPLIGQAEDGYSLVSYLPKEVQVELCQIIGDTYSDRQVAFEYSV